MSSSQKAAACVVQETDVVVPAKLASTPAASASAAGADTDPKTSFRLTLRIDNTALRLDQDVRGAASGKVHSKVRGSAPLSATGEPSPAHRQKREPLAQETASKNDETKSSLGPIRFFSSFLGLRHRRYSALSAWQRLTEKPHRRVGWWDRAIIPAQSALSTAL